MIRYERKIPVEDYQRLRDSVNWLSLSERIAKNAVNNCYYSVCAYDDDKVVGMMRLVWTGDECAQIQDVIVNEEYRFLGIGKTMIWKALDYMKSDLEHGEEVKVLVISAPGRESFYEQFGFSRRPRKDSSWMLDMWIKKE